MYYTTGSGHDLTHTTVDGISVQHYIQQLEAATADLNNARREISHERMLD